MIFVTVGTNEARFDRLLQAVGMLRTDEEIVVQHGASNVRPSTARATEFLPFDRLVAEVRQARAVVTHAGVGSIFVALANGKKPIVMPRLARFGEAVDDHQRLFADRFARAGLVTVVSNADELAAAIAAPAEDAEPERLGRDNALAVELRAYIGACVDRAVAE